MNHFLYFHFHTQKVFKYNTPKLSLLIHSILYKSLILKHRPPKLCFTEITDFAFFGQHIAQHTRNTFFYLSILRKSPINPFRYLHIRRKAAGNQRLFCFIRDISGINKLSTKVIVQNFASLSNQSVIQYVKDLFKNTRNNSATVLQNLILRLFLVESSQIGTLIPFSQDR